MTRHHRPGGRDRVRDGGPGEQRSLAVRFGRGMDPLGLSSPITHEGIAADLRRLGLSPGDSLIVHSSLKSIGWLEGGPDAVIDALQEVLTPRGNLAIPTFTSPAPEFVVSDTPCRTGLIPETFRRRPGVLRSTHPTHSVAAWGDAAAEVAAGHERATALGVDSPLHRMAKLGARVLMIGVDCTRCSLIHVAEATMRLPYLGIAYPGYDVPIVVRKVDGTTTVYHETEFPGDSSNFGIVERECGRRAQVIHGRIGAADCLMIQGRHLLDAAIDLLRHDPGCLLCRSPFCVPCAESRRLVDPTAQEQGSE